MLAAGSDRQHAGNSGYEDEPEAHYLWDSTVANHAGPSRGDRILIRDKHQMIGASVIERVERGELSKPRRRCPECGKTNITARKTASPRYRCSRPECQGEFDEPIVEWVRVTTYKTYHSAAWTTPNREVSAAELREACESPRSQQSIRPMVTSMVDQLLGRSISPLPSKRIERLSKTISGGHVQSTTMVRRGQGRFRQSLIERFGNVCAFTGPQPQEVLEAAHLNSFAHDGEHSVGAGLLLRRDVHKLFDGQLLLVNPDTLRIHVDSPVREFDAYAALHDSPLHVEVNEEAIGWFRARWEES